MFGDLDRPLNASRGLSAISEFLVYARDACYYTTENINMPKSNISKTGRFRDKVSIEH